MSDKCNDWRFALAAEGPLFLKMEREVLHPHPGSPKHQRWFWQTPKNISGLPSLLQEGVIKNHRDGRFHIQGFTWFSSLPLNTFMFVVQAVSGGGGFIIIIIILLVCSASCLSISVWNTFLFAVQLHFIQCPFPNQIQFGLEKLHSKIVYDFPNQFQFGLER